MKNVSDPQAAPLHQEFSQLIPWYLNETIADQEREMLDSHLRTCTVCRDDLAREQDIYRSMRAAAAIEYMPAASLKLLQARLDGVAIDAARAGAPVRLPTSHRRMPWQGLMAASAALIAVALSLLAADRWLQFRASPNYYTVTKSVPRPADEVIRAVFSPGVTLVELQGMLDESGLKIIFGPTEAGVYSLAAKSDRPVSSSLALLRSHDKVRFAESTIPESRTP